MQNAEAITVTQLTRSIKVLLESHFERICLQGEISNLARPGSGHIYFNVKDENSQISGVMFRSSVQRSRFNLENGQELYFFGRITVYEPRGTYQIIVDRVEPIGSGALQLAFEQLKKKLLEEGLFDEEKKKPIPFIPQGIGIVTSPTGAAVRDILNILNRRFPGVPVLINPVSVQGESAAGEIAQAVMQLNRQEGVDVIIVGRGGGSIEDLWAFNEEIVARAIYASEIPVVSAVGHETDFTIADFVADLRAPTPSAAAELVVPVRDELLLDVQSLENELKRQVRRKLDLYSDRLQYYRKRLRSPDWVIQRHMMKVDELTASLQQLAEKTVYRTANHYRDLRQRLLLKSPLPVIDSKKQRINELKIRVEGAMNTLVQQKKNRIGELSHVLDTLSPLLTMARGYSVAVDDDGNTMTSVKQAKKDSRFNLHFHDGSIEAITEKIFKHSI